MYEIEEMYMSAQKGALPKTYLSDIFNNGFDDYNNEFGTEIRFIIKSILDNDNNIIEKDEVLPLLSLVGEEAPNLFSNFFDKVTRNNLEITSRDFDYLLFFNPPQIKNGDNIIDYIFNQKDFQLTELQLLNIFAQHKSLADKIILQDNLFISQPVYDYLKGHFEYRQLVNDKNVTILESKDSTIKTLSQELLLTENYIHDLEVKNIPYHKESVGNFLKQTYTMIFDQTNPNRDKFTFVFAKNKIDKAVESIKINKAVESINYPKQFDLNTIAQMRNNPNNQFGKLKK